MLEARSNLFTAAEGIHNASEQATESRLGRRMWGTVMAARLSLHSAAPQSTAKPSRVSRQDAAQLWLGC